MDARVSIKINVHGYWDNHLEIEGDYETIVKPEIDRFYEHSKLAMDKINEHEKIYQLGSNDKLTP